MSNDASLTKTATDPLAGRFVRLGPLVLGLSSPKPAGYLKSHKDAGIALLVFLVCLLAYNANWRLIATGDSYSARYLPFSIWRYHTLKLDPVSTLAAQGRKIGGVPDPTKPKPDKVGRAYWLVRNNESHLVSIYPVAAPLILAPFYLPAVSYLDAKGWEPWRVDFVARIMEKLSASVLAALSAALMYMLLRRRTGRRTALLLTAAFAFGTTTWMISSQALWQHGLAELLIVSMLLVVTGTCTTRGVIAAGLLCGLIASNRPPDAILAAAPGLYGLWWAGRKAPLMVGAALLPLSLLLAYNFIVAGHWAGGYGLVGEKDFFEHNALSGLAGLLFSPTRGLFFFSPFLLFIPFCARQILAERSTRFLTIAICIAATLELAVYSLADWRQGGAWGPRWLTSMLPLLVWMLPPAVHALSRAGTIAFVSACLVAIATEAVGAYWYTGTSNAAIYAIDKGPNAMHAAWDFRNTPFVAELRHPRAPAELATEVRGSLDIATTSDGRDLRAANGTPIAVEGWALADGDTPREVVIMLDGRVVATTSDFFVRSDVSQALGVASPSGWRITIGARELKEGYHVLAFFVRVAEGGDLFFVADHRFPLGLRGSLDIATTSDGRDLSAASGNQLSVEGWAIAGGLTPREAIIKLDGQVVGTTSNFFVRPDVSKALGVASPTGWRLTIGSRELAEGDHVLAVSVRGVEGSDSFFVVDRHFTVGSPSVLAQRIYGDLGSSARRASAFLAGRQQAPGYWLTSHTRVTRYENPQPELNTYLPSVLVDTLDPVPKEAGLAGNIQRARRYLSSQIEDGGLVRYYGRPEAVGGGLGCVITPDADDTALVWRIAPATDRKLLPMALATLKHYRTTEGLYRTWLASRDSYQCLDPGKDPNPADITNQMHVLMFLARADPPAAQELCRALGRTRNADGIWVYYRNAPIVPILRQADLRRAGCTLELPASRLQTTLTEQGVWLKAAEMLRIFNTADLATPPSATVMELLREISRDDFSMVRKAPPLLYHNDLTATVPRFYWSEEMGYAVWLRLYYEQGRQQSGGAVK